MWKLKKTFAKDSKRAHFIGEENAFHHRIAHLHFSKNKKNRKGKKGVKLKKTYQFRRVREPDKRERGNWERIAYGKRM